MLQALAEGCGGGAQGPEKDWLPKRFGKAIGRTNSAVVFGDHR
jgi:hypothetical protein